MKIAVLAAAGLLLTASVTAPALADTIPSLTGTWKGNSDGVALKGGWLSGEVTLVVAEQKGRSFRGRYTYPAGGQSVTEDVVGTVSPDGDRILFTGDDGHHIAEYDDGVIDDCYVLDGDRSMAVCMRLQKQP